MLEEVAERLIFLHRPDQLLQVFEAPRGFGGALGLQCGSIAAFVEDLPSQLGMGQRLRHVAPAGEIAHKAPKRLARLPGQLVGADDTGGGEAERHAFRTGDAMDLFQCLVAQPALGNIDDTFEGKVVGGLVDEAQIGNGVADFRALIEAKAAHDAMGQADRDEPLLEFAGLEGCAHENGDLIDTDALPPQRLDLLADPPCFLRPVPHADDADFLACVGLGPQRLAQSPAILRDHAGRRREDLRRRTIILFQPDDLRAGKVPLEAQDVRHFGAAPRIDALSSSPTQQIFLRFCASSRSRDTGSNWCPDIRRPIYSGNVPDRIQGFRGQS